MVEALVGSSQSMLELRAYIRKVARSDASVLITGDTGTGKMIKDTAKTAFPSLPQRVAIPAKP